MTPREREHKSLTHSPLAETFYLIEAAVAGGRAGEQLFYI
jgi:hypothetical protein